MEDQKEKIPNPRTSKEIDVSQGTFAQEGGKVWYLWSMLISQNIDGEWTIKRFEEM